MEWHALAYVHAVSYQLYFKTYEDIEVSSELSCQTPQPDLEINKKVLLRERKRHTARRVASTCYVALSSDWGGGGGYLIQSLMGNPHPVPGGGGGYPGVHHSYSIWTWNGVPPLS